MSIQDESFPYDDLEMSQNSGHQRMVFPHHNPRRNVLQTNRVGSDGDGPDSTDAEGGCNGFSAPSSPRHINDSAHSSNEDVAEFETSGKTNASDPQDATDMNKNENSRTNQKKSVSYQDIHSEYTKRRYKHVESKVGQYIANMKAQDEKRRRSSKFQRHRSMPETLSGPRSIEHVPQIRNTPPKRGILRHSTNDLDDMREQESILSDHDTENFDNITATTSSSSRDSAQQDAGIYLDKDTYEKLLNDRERCEYLETKMEEEKAAYWRVKHNLDTMRIEYTMGMDKLKRQLEQTQRMSGRFSIGGMMGNSLGRSSLPSLSDGHPNTMDKGTQTDSLLTPSPMPSSHNRHELSIPGCLTPDSNNNSFDNAAVGVLAPAHPRIPKSIAAIQPTIQPLSLNFSNIMEQDNSRGEANINNTMGFIRQRANSLANRQRSTPLVNTTTNGNTSTTSSKMNDSIIDIGNSVNETSSIQKPRLSRREEFLHYQKRPQRYTFMESHRGHAITNHRELESSYSPDEISNTLRSSEDSGVGFPRKFHKRHGGIRGRLMRLFGACTKCDDPNISMDTLGNAQQRSFSQIPLLEKSRMNLRQNLR
ncbi:swallow [Haematobia irritans]|uniref:swallow n=1 Tax=Haematobia irritans TaxID=7368 RepID=UPI003F4FFCF8